MVNSYVVAIVSDMDCYIIYDIYEMTSKIIYSEPLWDKQHFL